MSFAESKAINHPPQHISQKHSDKTRATRGLLITPDVVPALEHWQAETKT